MTIAACAELVQKGDPDRFLATMAAPLWARELLFPLYAFNLEVAKAPWAAREPLIAEMRLQWWRDVIEASSSGAAKAHDVARPLHGLIRDAGLPLDVLDRMVAARHWDCWTEPFDDSAALTAYLEDTGAGLMWLAARALGAPDSAEPAIRDYGRASAMANFLRAVAGLESLSRHPVPAGAKVTDLARLGLGWLASARAARKSVPKAVAPALLSGWQADGLLRMAMNDPAAVAEGRLQLSEFARRGGLLWQAFNGRW